jgi:hypothetical protein
VKASRLRCPTTDTALLSTEFRSLTPRGARDFKESAFLKRQGKKDVKPLRVEAFELEHSAVVVYLFPYSAEISKKDGMVEFSALIGRLQVSQTFNVEEMQFQGKLEL